MKRTLRWPLIAFALLASCGGLFWSAVYESAAPAGGARISVEVRNCFADCALRVMVKDGQSSREIARGNDCVVMFVHAAWNGTEAAVFVDGSFCGPIRAAVDVATGKSIDYESAKEWLGRSIIETYAVSPDELAAHGGDVFQWATYRGDGRLGRSSQEFRRRMGWR